MHSADDHDAAINFGCPIMDLNCIHKKNHCLWSQNYSTVTVISYKSFLRATDVTDVCFWALSQTAAEAVKPT